MRQGLVTVLVACLAIACADGATSEPPEPQASPVTPILATTQLEVGAQRVAFVLEGERSLITEPEVTVQSFRPGEEEAYATATARFHSWPFGTRGSYSTDLTFDQPGNWHLVITTQNPGGPPTRATLALDIQDAIAVAPVGGLPPFLSNRTSAEVDSLAELTSAGSPDPDLYATSVLDAVISGLPSVVVFSSPAFCVSPTCGPQVDVLSQLKDSHRGKANFIHIEIYDNPAEIQGDLSRARYNPLVPAWGLDANPGWSNESWTFLLGRDGRIAARYEAFVPVEELEPALVRLLDH